MMSGAWQRIFDRWGYEVIERVSVFILFSWLCDRIFKSWMETGNWYPLLLLASESLILIFMIFRRSSENISHRPQDWILALAAMLLPMLVQPFDVKPFVSPGLCAFLLLVGFTTQLYAKLSLWRSFGVVAANRGIVGRGPYRIIRHPMYASYFVSHIGFLLMYPTFWNAVVYGVSATIQIMRLLAEERLLSQSADYRALMMRVPYRIMPGVF